MAEYPGGLYQSSGLRVEQALFGEVAEWPKARHWKCRRRETVSRVQIPPSPPNRACSTRRPDDYFRPPGCYLIYSDLELARAGRPSTGLGRPNSYSFSELWACPDRRPDDYLRPP